MTHKTPVNEGFAVTMEELRFPSACHSFSMHGSPHLNPICSGAAIKTALRAVVASIGLQE